MTDILGINRQRARLHLAEAVDAIKPGERTLIARRLAAEASTLDDEDLATAAIRTGLLLMASADERDHRLDEFVTWIEQCPTRTRLESVLAGRDDIFGAVSVAMAWLRMGEHASFLQEMYAR